MAWDVLQRWKEGHHVDTSQYVRAPYIRPAIPKYTPWPAVAAALQNVLPELDPLRIAQRRVAAAQLPIQLATLKLQQQYGIPMEQARYKALMGYYQGGGNDLCQNGFNILTGKPCTPDELNRSAVKRTYSAYEGIANSNPPPSTSAQPAAKPAIPEVQSNKQEVPPIINPQIQSPPPPTAQNVFNLPVFRTNDQPVLDFTTPPDVNNKSILTGKKYITTTDPDTGLPVLVPIDSAEAPTPQPPVA